MRASTSLTATMKRLSTRRLPSQDRARRSLTALLHSAERLIEKDGFDQVTTKSIAEAAGLSIGLVYEYFPNKESILLELGRQWMHGIRAIVEELHPTRSGITDVLTLLNRGLASTEKHYRDRPGLGAVINSLSAIPELREVERAHDNHCVECLVGAMKYLHPEADVDELAAISRCCITMSHSVLNECLVKRTGDPKRMIPNLKVALFGMLMPILAVRSPLASHDVATVVQKRA